MFAMTSTAHRVRFAFICLALGLLAACAPQKQPAQKLLGDIDATVMAASAEAAKYVPDQLRDVQAKFGELKASFDKQDYAAVISGAPAVLGAAQTLATDAAARKDQILKALNNEWTVLAGSVPEDMTAVQNRIDTLKKKSAKKPAAGVDLEAAKSSLDEAGSLWSKAQAAFASGSLDEAVKTAQAVKSRVDAVAAALMLDLAAPAARSWPSKGEGALTDDDGAARNAYRGQAVLVDVQTHPDLAGPLHLVSLPAHEGRRLLSELTRVPEIGGQHGVRIAADRVLRYPQSGTEHARFRP